MKPPFQERLAAAERAASAALYPSSRRQIAVAPKSPGAASTARGMATGGSPMPHTNLQPELVERRRLIAALDQRTLQALSTHGDIDDRAMARSEIRLRELNSQTVRVCRHCGIGAPEALAMNEPVCPGRGFHSYVDTPVSQPLPDLLETGWGR